MQFKDLIDGNTSKTVPKTYRTANTKSTTIKTTSTSSRPSVSTVTASDIAATSRKENLVCIYDAAAGAYLFLDGEIQIEHNFILEISDKASSQEKDAEVNNAKIKPDEIKIEGVISNVMNRSGTLTSQYSDRVASATQYLYNLQKSRTLCQVITNLITYNDMLIKSVAVVQDESTGADSANFSIVMHQRIQTKKTKNTGNSNNTSTTVDTDSQSSLIYKVGEWLNNNIRK